MHIVAPVHGGDTMRIALPSLVGIVATGATAVAASPPPSTYTPGRSETPVHTYSIRRSAVSSPRGGGPAEVPTARSTQPVRRMPTGIQSDNQTRRPGAINYTAHPHQKDVTQSGHTVPYPSGVNIAGDHFESHTASATRGLIPSRAPNSNEGTFRAAPTTRGGGPRTRRLPPLAHSRPIENYLLTGPAAVQRGEINPTVVDLTLQQPTLTKADIASLPARYDGTAGRDDGLLARDPTISSAELNDTTGHVAAQPELFRLQTHYPATTRAVGGGPADVPTERLPTDLQRALERVPGR